MIRINNLSFSYPPSRRGGESRPLFSEFSLDIQEGHIFGLLGPNGGGKTTLFRILSTALKPQNGTIHFFEQDLFRNANKVREKIGVVFQHPSLDKKLTLKENLVAQGYLYGLQGDQLTQKIQRVLQKLGLVNRQNDYVEHLSGGLQRRGEIAKCLLHDPKVLLMDEPSTGLDPGARRDLWDTLFSLQKMGVTILLTTHLMEEGEKCHQVAILHQGKVQAKGTPHDLKNRIGGDVISLESENPDDLAKKIQDAFKLDSSVVEKTVRLEIANGHIMIPKLIEAFPGLIKSATVGKPTLEDVFVHETGHRFWEA